MNIAQVITQELGISPQQTEAVIRLIDEGNTIPFIARYRKEMTGAMNDEVLRKFDERLRSLRALEERSQTVLTTIEGLGQLLSGLNMPVVVWKGRRPLWSWRISTGPTGRSAEPER